MVIQQLIQSQLFHLISMLICVGVIAWLFVRHYFGSESHERDRIRLLNTLYISGILTFIIIELVTAICMGNTKHADILSFVSFAATLSSLLLSIVAIIFTIVSGKRGESQYEKLSKVSDAVTSSLSEFTIKTGSIDSSIDRFKSVADGLMGEIHEIYEKLTVLEQPINEMKEWMSLSENNPKEPKKTKEGVERNKSFSPEGFIAHGSFSGNLALYACALSLERGRPFKMGEFKENDDDEAYSFGYIIAASAMGIVSVKVTGQRSIEVSYCFDNLRELTEKALNEFVNDGSRVESKDKYSARINHVKSIFK